MIQNPIILFFSYFFVFLCCLTILSILGEIVFRLIMVRSVLTYLVLARNIFVGLILLTSVFAIIQTRFITIEIIYIFLLGCGVYEVRQNKNHIERLVRLEETKVNFLLVVVGALALFLWGWISIYNAESFIQFNYLGDQILYSKISKAISETGFENGFGILNHFDSSYHGTEPYHYFELWACALVASASGLNHYLTLQLIIYPIFFFLIWLNLLALIKAKGFWTTVIISILLLFVGGLYLPFYEHVPFLGLLRNFGLSAMSPWASKLSYFYVFILSAYHLYSNNLRSLSVLCLLGLTIASIVSLPVIAISLGVLIGYEVYSSPSLWRKQLKDAFYLLVTVLLIISFYAMFQRKSTEWSNVGIASTMESILSNLVNMNLVTQRNIILGGLVHLLICYLPLIPVLWLYLRVTDNRNSDQTLYFKRLGVSSILVGLLGWAFLYRDINSFQVFSVITLPLMNCAVAIGIISILNHFEYIWSKYRTLSMISAILVVCVVGVQISNALPGKRIRSANQYSQEYLQKVEQITRINNLQVGASVKDESLLEEPHNKFNAVYPLGEYLTLVDESIAIVNIGDFNTPLDSTSGMNYERTLKAMGSGIFYRYVVEHVGKYPSARMVDSLQATFVDRHKIQFLILSKDATLPKNLINRLETSVSDTRTGEKFILLK